jgi:hypothetical protein
MPVDGLVSAACAQATPYIDGAALFPLAGLRMAVTPMVTATNRTRPALLGTFIGGDVPSVRARTVYPRARTHSVLEPPQIDAGNCVCAVDGEAS